MAVKEIRSAVSGANSSIEVFLSAEALYDIEGRGASVVLNVTPKLAAAAAAPPAAPAAAARHRGRGPGGQAALRGGLGRSWVAGLHRLLLGWTRSAWPATT